MSQPSRPPSEIANDIRVMINRGCDAAYIRAVLRWKPRSLADFCERHGIALPDAGEGSMPVRNLSAGADKRGWRRRGAGRSVTLSAVTTPAIAAALEMEAGRRRLAKGHVMHMILAATHARGLWGDLIDSEVSEASPMQSSEQQ